MGYDSFVRGIYFICIWDTTHLYAGYGSFVYGIRLICTWGMIHLYMGYDSLVNVRNAAHKCICYELYIHLVFVAGLTHLHMGHDLFARVTGHICVRDKTYSHM